MKNLFITILVLYFTIINAQQKTAYQPGEFFLFNVSYGFINAGKATLELSESRLNDKKVFFAKGYGYTTGLSKMFFKVEDHYHSYFDKNSGEPYQSVRDIYEGGYEKKQHTYFDNTKNTAVLKDLKKKSEQVFHVPNQIQDVVSAFYYLRNHPGIDTIKEGQTLVINMFFDDEVINFKLKFSHREVLKTKVGKVATMVFKPYVLKGRVFKESESLTMWVSDDLNKIPLRIKADLLVGSIKADLESYKGLKHPLAFR